MFKNYFMTAIRNIHRNKANSFINIFGLSVGIAITVLVFLFVHDEYSYDEFHQDADLIYAVWRNTIDDRGVRTGGQTSIRIADDFKALYPEIDHVVRMSYRMGIVRNDQRVHNQRIHFVDDNFFDVFSFPVLKGNANNPLDDIHSVVITKEMANKFFGGRTRWRRR